MFMRRRRAPAAPSVPVPRSSKEDGSGTGDGVEAGSPGRELSGPVPNSKVTAVMVVPAVTPGRVRRKFPVP